MERFVTLIVAGGIALVAGLWATTLLDSGTGPWLLGVVLAVFGVGSLLVGIGSEIDVR